MAVQKDEGSYASEAHSCLDFGDVVPGGLSSVFGDSDKSFPKPNYARNPSYGSIRKVVDLQELEIWSVVSSGS